MKQTVRFARATPEMPGMGEGCAACSVSPRRYVHNAMNRTRRPASEWSV